jgi:hypothetical protein
VSGIATGIATGFGDSGGGGTYHVVAEFPIAGVTPIIEWSLICELFDCVAAVSSLNLA